MKKLKFENPSPTAIEKKMLNYCGLYPIEKEKGSLHNTDFVKYVTIYLDENLRENYPTCIEVSDEHIDFDNIIIFYGVSKTVELNLSLCDVEVLTLVLERCKELGWDMSLQ